MRINALVVPLRENIKLIAQANGLSNTGIARLLQAIALAMKKHPSPEQEKALKYVLHVTKDIIYLMPRHAQNAVLRTALNAPKIYVSIANQIILLQLISKLAQHAQITAKPAMRPINA